MLLLLAMGACAATHRGRMSVTVARTSRQRDVCSTWDLRGMAIMDRNYRQRMRTLLLGGFWTETIRRCPTREVSYDWAGEEVAAAASTDVSAVMQVTCVSGCSGRGYGGHRMSDA